MDASRFLTLYRPGHNAAVQRQEDYHALARLLVHVNVAHVVRVEARHELLTSNPPRLVGAFVDNPEPLPSVSAVWGPVIGSTVWLVDGASIKCENMPGDLTAELNEGAAQWSAFHELVREALRQHLYGG